MKNHSGTLKEKLGKLVPYILLLPAFTLFTLFSYWPFLKSLYLSLTVTNKKGQPVKFVKFANYIKGFTFGNYPFYKAIIFSFMKN